MTICITIAARGSQSDITDLYKRIEAFVHESELPMDYRTKALAKMLDEEQTFRYVELTSPVTVEFSLRCEYEYDFSLENIISQVEKAYEDVEVFYYFTIDECTVPYPMVYDPNKDVFKFDEPVFYITKDVDFGEELDDLIENEYNEWLDTLPDEE